MTSLTTPYVSSNSKVLNDYVRAILPTPLVTAWSISDQLTRSNSVILWERARLARFTVSRVLYASPSPSHSLGSRSGALNWATGETVAVKEIQLSNIPKGELGQIMVRAVSSSCLYP
jgi:hypothetical protein